MVEGIASDLKRGHLPILIAETGLKSEFQFTALVQLKKTATAALLIGIGIYLIMRNKHRERRTEF